MENQLLDLFYEHFSEKATIAPIPAAASNRNYYRLITSNHSTVIGVFNDNLNENTAFCYLAKYFYSHNIQVPQLYAQNLNKGIYIQEDLGDSSLYQKVKENQHDFSKTALIDCYKLTIDQLVKMQFSGSLGLDYNQCYPVAAFDKQAMLWDLNYFKYNFLKFVNIPFDEWALEKDFRQLVDFLSKAAGDYFMHRDFQSRNIMFYENKPYIIDFQGGRKGPLQYDLISLLYQASVKMPNNLRTSLKEYYLSAIDQLGINKESFNQYFDGFVYLRTMQVLGAYGFRGIFENKPYFKNSIPLAANNLRGLLQGNPLPLALPELEKVWTNIVEKFSTKETMSKTTNKLTVRVQSFSYIKGGIPEDPSGNGGGFVIDCRSVLNPGRIEAYKTQTGRDEGVIKYLETTSNIAHFLDPILQMVDGAVENYLERGFEHLMVSFGCTGGQHRSVYSADKMAKHLEDKYSVKVILHHIEQEKKNWVNETY